MSLNDHGRPHGSTDSHVLVIGHLGMLGRDLMKQLERNGLKGLGLDLPDVDITNGDQVRRILVDRRPAVVVNCAGYTAVDKAESEPGPAFAINRDGPGNLADACRSAGASLIHISTDYVFDGRADRPYVEEDPVNPLGVYARSKWEGEEIVRKRLPEHLIVRTAWMFGVQGGNFVKTILRLSEEREELKVVCDQVGCPTWSMDLAGALVALATRILKGYTPIAWGTYHFCGAGKVSWHGFAREIVEEGRRHRALKVKNILPIPTTDYPTPAARPLWSVLDCRKIAGTFGIVPPSWRIGLEKVVRGIYLGEEV
ncbi:MAG: dTDP-4-dehydrorhamnose reductase [Deltaproteobacteria bacterium]|nr:dTDP-4-dehydrorhamnose reductase [Deltaproteobacteria bacterium]